MKQNYISLILKTIKSKNVLQIPALSTALYNQAEFD